MSKPAKSIYYFAWYMVLEVIFLMLSPQSLLHLTKISPVDAVWLRMIAGIVGGLTIYYFTIALREVRTLFLVPVYERSTVFLATLALYLFDHAHVVVLGVGILDMLGALWTLWAVKSEAASFRVRA